MYRTKFMADVLRLVYVMKIAKVVYTQETIVTSTQIVYCFSFILAIYIGRAQRGFLKRNCFLK